MADDLSIPPQDQGAPKKQKTNQTQDVQPAAIVPSPLDQLIVTNLIDPVCIPYIKEFASVWDSATLHTHSFPFPPGRKLRTCRIDDQTAFWKRLNLGRVPSKMSDLKSSALEIKFHHATYSFPLIPLIKSRARAKVYQTQIMAQLPNADFHIVTNSSKGVQRMKTVQIKFGPLFSFALDAPLNNPPSNNPPSNNPPPKPPTWRILIWISSTPTVYVLDAFNEEVGEEEANYKAVLEVMRTIYVSCVTKGSKTNTSRLGGHYAQYLDV
eukprot:TRINITY_DN5424_c0_g1_i2.p1 TRINITY_DN5424_c0_g1~~TRINITY_DN5424_c0_g1_i2.p1  ORF type:complete len:267 (+),score=31.02 TRINITY_DN5424_c0_g1_i2:595-1395(+)